MRLTAAEFDAIQNRGKKSGRVKNVTRMEIDGITFDSTKEARRYQDLRLMQQAGQIKELTRQVRFPIYLHEIFICDWLADFTYRLKHADGGYSVVIEDVKGWKTDVYKLKKRLFEAQYKMQIKET